MIKEYSKTYYLSAGECNPQRELPLPLLMNRVIDVATMHANVWGVGYERLIADNHAWVLARVTVEMKRYPRVNENYTLTTWIEGYNRLFSQRNMEITDEQGCTLGYVRTIWMVIDLDTRKSVDMESLTYISENIIDRPCPIAPQGHLRPVEEGFVTEHTFGYVECDFNRHVNTVRYLELLINQFDMSYFDNNVIHRMEVAFIHETHYGECVQVIKKEEGERDWHMVILKDGINRVRARFQFVDRTV
ncbi:MAG: acyl-[acyl-carrier-protein] thioesterase [Muribaculaceae bacterium]|nr:acyl-[acyl-carrier-protein] thioesterase [Muribaculaceae bacterium]